VCEALQISALLISLQLFCHHLVAFVFMGFTEGCAAGESVYQIWIPWEEFSQQLLSFWSIYSRIRRKVQALAIPGSLSDNTQDGEKNSLSKKSSAFNTQISSHHFILTSGWC